MRNASRRCGGRSERVVNATWQSILSRLAEFQRGEAGAPQKIDATLEELELRNGGSTTELGERLYMAAHVLMDADQESAVIGDLLKRQPTVNGFCEALWPFSEVPVDGAVNLIRRLSGSKETEAKRLLELMNRGKLISYNRNKPRLRVLYNPGGMEADETQADSERKKSHLLAPDTRYGNLLALRELLRVARMWIRWYEQQMPPKVMEVLYGELASGNVTEVRLLSGPANITKRAQSDFLLFQEELKRKRGIEASWRVLSKDEAANHHDRFFISEDLSRNLPPLNSILKGTTGEILPSAMTAAGFDQLWARGVEIQSIQFSDS